MFSDWKTYVMIISTVMMVFIDCSDCDYFSAVWVVLAFALWCANYISQIYITEYRRISDRYEDVMSIQAAIIKELTDKLDGRKDNADSGAGVVAEESLQAHEE